MNTREELRTVLEAFEILSPAAFRFRGQSMPVTPGYLPSVPGIPSHPLPEMPLVRDLQSILYAHCYAQRIEQPTATPDVGSGVTDPTFLPKLSASNMSRAGWDSGWAIYQISPAGQVWVVKGDRQRSALPGEFFSDAPPGAGAQVGGTVTVQVPRESTVAQAGFYYIYGETLGDVWDDGTLVRFYFHAASQMVADLIRELTSRLNRYQIPFRMKALNEPSASEEPTRSCSISPGATTTSRLGLSMTFHDR